MTFEDSVNYGLAALVALQMFTIIGLIGIVGMLKNIISEQEKLK